MPSLPTLPVRSWLERASLTLSSGVTVVGAAGIVGWWLHFEELTAPFPGLAPIRFNAALALFLLGGVLVAIDLGMRAASRLAVIPAALGLATLIEHIFRRNFHIDEIFARDPAQFETDAPGRMSAMVATCLLLAGASLAWRAFDRGARSRLFAEAVAVVWKLRLDAVLHRS